MLRSLKAVSASSVGSSKFARGHSIVCASRSTGSPRSDATFGAARETRVPANRREEQFDELPKDEAVRVRQTGPRDH